MKMQMIDIDPGRFEVITKFLEVGRCGDSSRHKGEPVGHCED